MRIRIILATLLCVLMGVQAQNTTIKSTISDRFSKLTFGGYGHIDYNQRISADKRYNGTLDAHRFVLYVGYQFSPKVQLFSEIEIEHGEEVYLEQGYINYKIHPSFQLRGGLMLIPMGIINESHEPDSYNGVERPNVDKMIVPSTWREIGVGITGVLPNSGLRYQFYVLTGFNGYDTAARFNGKDGLRKGRQKGLASYMSSPNLSMKVNYTPINGLELGLSGYLGKSQSKLYHNTAKNDAAIEMRADSSVVGVTMVGLDAVYKKVGWQLKGEYIYSSLSNTKEYNAFGATDLGSNMYGGYVEVAYNLLHNVQNCTNKLLPFVRYENYNTHASTDGIALNNAYHWQEWIAGISFYPANKIAIKADYQYRKNDMHETEHYINMGVGFSF